MAAFSMTLGTQAAFADDWASFGLSSERLRHSAEVSGARFSAQWEHRASTTEEPADRALLASPAVGDGYVVYGTQRNRVRALRATDGKLLWDQPIAGAVLATPALWRGRAIVLGVDERLTAHRLEDGAVLWSRDMGALGYASPEVVSGSIYLATGNPRPRVLRIDALTGDTVWSAGEKVLDQAVLAGVAVAQSRVIVSEVSGRHHAFSAADGSWVWTVETGGTVGGAAPLVTGGRVYVLPGGGDGQLHAFDLGTGAAVAGWPIDVAPAVDAPAGTTRLERRVVSSSLAAMGQERLVGTIRLDDTVNGASGRRFVSREYLVAVDLVNPAVGWTLLLGTLDTASARDVPTHGQVPTPLLYRGTEGQTFVVAASSLDPRVRTVNLAGGAAVWSTLLGGTTRASPVFANGQIIVATDAGTVVSFRSGSNGAPVAPTLGFSPSEGQAVDPRAAGLTLRWGSAFDPDGDTVRYEIRVDDDGEILRDWDIQSITLPLQQSIEVGAQLQTGRRYVFGVRARDSRGAYSAWSRLESFETVETPAVTVEGRPTSGLTDAIGQARPGERISLGAGVFPLASTLRLPPGVSLSGAGPHLTTLQGKGLAVGVVPGAGSALSNLAVAGAAVGVSVDGATDVRLRNVILRDNQDAGLDVALSGSAELVSATVVRNGSGVRAAGPTRVRNALVIRNRVGLEATAAGAIGSRYNNVLDNAAGDYRNVAKGPTDLAQAVAFVSTDEGDLRLQAAQATTDRGDPTDDFALEPEPNGRRINIGAFGNTAFAELSPITGTEPDPTPAPPGTPGGAPMGGQPAPGASPSGQGEPGSATQPEGAKLRGGGCATAGRGGTGGSPGLIVLLALLALQARRRRHRI